MFEMFDLKSFVTERGTLTPLELKDFLSFEVKRVYLLSDSAGKERFGHAHFKEEEFFLMVSGSCEAEIHDGEKWIKFNMEANKNGIYVGNKIWHNFKNFSEDGVLLALSSTNYNPNREDYEEDLENFLASNSK